MSTKIKICGITNAQDALATAEAGADALGFVFWERSPRFVTPETVAGIVPQLPPHVIKVGVFVNAAEDLVYRAIRECGLNVLQFHGNETPDYCKQFGLMSMKAIRVKDQQSIALCRRFNTEALLLDAWSPAQPGGTGAVFDWDLAVQVQALGRTIFLAGGLTPDNVGEAIRKVRPFGVDVSSGVEKEPGKKDAGKVRAFIQAARAASVGSEPLKPLPLFSGA